MSATGRGKRLDDSGNDYYGTPSWCVDRLLEKWSPVGGLWVEPGAGKGNIIRAVNVKRKDVHWIAFEKDNQHSELMDLGKLNLSEVYYKDFLIHDSINPTVEVVIGNPPYNNAQQFIEKSFYLYPNAHVAMLLRINFLASEERHSFIEQNTPDLFVLPNRPPFRKNKKGKWATDATEYAWFCWGPENQRAGLVHILNLTSKKERKDCREPEAKKIKAKLQDNISVANLLNLV